MLSANDLQQKFRMVPGQVTVTFTSKNPDVAGFSLAGARKRPLTRQDLQTFGDAFLHTDSVSWWLPTANLGGYTPQKGDIITDSDSVAWHIDYAVSALMEADWQCFAHKAAV